jgi:N-acetylmuramoyl-L-alanine amidase
MKIEVVIAALVATAALHEVAYSAECPRIVTRAQWGARPPTGRRPINKPVPKVLIHHTTTERCRTQASCAKIVKRMQNQHMDGPEKWSDIGYNFLVGEDGNVYEGRGWNTIGAHALGWNPKSYGISIIGNFMNAVPNRKALDAVKKLIACGQPSRISSSYSLHGHRDGVCTQCPGDKLYSLIKTWPRFKGKLDPVYCP